MNFFTRLNDEHISAFGNNWAKFIIWGIALTILGCLAIGASAYTTWLTVVMLGFIIFLSGMVFLIDAFTFWWKKSRGFYLHVIVAGLYIFTGCVLIQEPVKAASALTLILGVFYVLAGIFRIGFSSVVQPPRWGWGWLNGIVTLLLGMLILTAWPASTLFIIGLLVGIDLVFAGLTYISSGLAAKASYT